MRSSAASKEATGTRRSRSHAGSSDEETISSTCSGEASSRPTRARSSTGSERACMASVPRGSFAKWSRWPRRIRGRSIATYYGIRIISGIDKETASRIAGLRKRLENA